jgi:hypothetical protein
VLHCTGARAGVPAIPKHSLRVIVIIDYVTRLNLVPFAVKFQFWMSTL